MTKLIIIAGLLFLALLFIVFTTKKIFTTIGSMLASKGTDKTLSVGIGFWFIVLSIGYVYPLWSFYKKNYVLNSDMLGLLYVSLICLVILFFGFCIRCNVRFKKYKVSYDFHKHKKCPECQGDNFTLTKAYYESNKDNHFQNRNDILFAPPETLGNQSLTIGLVSAILISVGLYVILGNVYIALIIGVVIFGLTYFMSRKLLNEPFSIFDENSKLRTFWEHSMLCRNCGKRFIFSSSDND